MSEHDLPADIAEVIDRVYRKHDNAFLEAKLVHDKKWLELVRKISDPYIVRDRTDLFNYGRAHAFRIWLTEDQRAAEMNAEIETDLLEDTGLIESVHLDISVLVDYFLIFFSNIKIVNNNVVRQCTLFPLSEEQAKLADLLAQKMSDLRYRPLDKTLAYTVVPDAETELRPLGTATVADFLMGE